MPRLQERYMGESFGKGSSFAASGGGFSTHSPMLQQLPSCEVLESGCFQAILRRVVGKFSGTLELSDFFLTLPERNCPPQEIDDTILLVPVRCREPRKGTCPRCRHTSPN